MSVENQIINRVDQSGIITINLEDFYPEGDRVLYDIKVNLSNGLILREKDFREFIKQNDWKQYATKYVAITCTANAVIPMWAYMLLAINIESYAKLVVFGDLQTLEAVLMQKSLSGLDVNQFKDKKIVIKGCGEIPLPASAYVEITRLLKPVATSIMYGEPCSTVPIYKKLTKEG